MFAGHVGAGLALGRVERRINVGVLVTAALLLDLLIWSFVLLGWEAVVLPADFARTHQAEYTFPWSHGLVAAVAWSALAGAVAYAAAWRGVGRARAAAVVAAAVFSHWLLDALVHRPELPVLGDGSAKLGLGLWGRLPAALAVEAALLLGGVTLFVSGSALPRGRRVALIVLALLTLALTVAGMTSGAAPPSAQAMAAVSLVTLLVVCGLSYWLGRAPVAPARSSGGSPS